MTTPYYPRNQWYVAATSDELGDRPLARTICDEPLVLYRGSQGRVAALSDRCPHRKAPLSSGKIHGDDIACGYHGIRFHRSGRCTLVPSGTVPGPRFAARAFPVHEQNGLIFIWPGEAEAADCDLLPDFDKLVAPGWTDVRGLVHVAANYQLLMDNVLDLTHVMFLHQSTFGGSGVADAPLQVDAADDDTVRAQRIMYNVDSAPIFKAARGLDGKIDRWQLFDYRPPVYLTVTLGARPAGSDEPIGAPTHIVYNVFTPETATSTHYFWFTLRNWALDDDGVSQVYKSFTDRAFAEDKALVERQQELIASDTSGTPLRGLAFDRAGMAARSIIERLITSDSVRQTSAPSASQTSREATSRDVDGVDGVDDASAA